MASPATPLPPVVFEDGLGQRRRVVGARNQTLSVLFLDGELTTDPAFETALRERLTGLAGFHHDAFARARGVVHVTRTPLRLALASDYVEGVRLSEMLTIADERLIPIEIDAAFGVIRQVAAAVAALHEQGGTSHGALAPERILVTGDARVVVTEYVLGAALEQLRFSPQRYWQDFRIALPPDPTALLDRRADVTQLGAMALALIVGRPLREDEYPGRIAEMVDGVRAISSTGLEQLPGSVRSWLRRALQLEPRTSFASAGEASAALDDIREVNERSARHALRALAATCQEALAEQPPVTETNPASVTSAAEPSTATLRPASAAPTLAVATAADRTASPDPAAGAPDARHERTAELRIVPRPEATGRMFASFGDAPATNEPAPPADAVDPAVEADEAERLDAEHGDTEHGDAEHDATESKPRAAVTRIWRQHRVAIAVAAVLLVASVATVAARNLFAGDPVGTLIVNTTPTGVAVVIDGEHRGATPLSLDLSPGSHVLQIVSDGFVRKIPVTITEGREVAQFIELPAAPPAAADGHLHVRTEPAGARVSIDGDYRGVAPLTIEGIAPGSHAVKVEDGNAAVTQQVTIEAGVTASLVVPLAATPRGAPVSGWIAVVAPADVQIYEQQRLLGSSRSEQIMVAAGRHDLEIVNEALGYRVTRTVQVPPGETATIRLEWPTGSLALNAQPWADVWLDGERIGETPIGNVQVPIGAHRVVFRHPELGEQAHNITVTLSAPARVSADMRKR